MRLLKNFRTAKMLTATKTTKKKAEDVVEIDTTTRSHGVGKDGKSEAHIMALQYV